jgi:hypothetical protein
LIGKKVEIASMTILTKELIEAGGTPIGINNAYSWKHNQTQFLTGVCRPSSGWVDRLVGVEIPDEDYHKFILMNRKCKAYELAKNWSGEV